MLGWNFCEAESLSRSTEALAARAPQGDLCSQLAWFPERNTSPALLVSSEAAVLYANPACLRGGD